MSTFDYLHLVWQSRPHLAFAFADFQHFLHAAFQQYHQHDTARLANEVKYSDSVERSAVLAQQRIARARYPAFPVGESPAFERVKDRLVIWLYGHIGPGAACSSDVLCDVLHANSDAAAVVVRIASAGGDAGQAICIADAILQHKGRTVAVVDKFAYSAATFVAAHCDRVLMRSDASWMVHNSRLNTEGDARRLRATISDLEVMDLQLRRAYARKRRMTTFQVQQHMDAGAFLSSAQALAAGFVDTIIPALPIDWGACHPECDA